IQILTICKLLTNYPNNNKFFIGTILTTFLNLTLKYVFSILYQNDLMPISIFGSGKRPSDKNSEIYEGMPSGHTQFMFFVTIYLALYLNENYGLTHRTCLLIIVTLLLAI